ncbi:hypothetical protein [Anabaena azotica]|uniref:Uncharacterized protein n=1 Tax=Anabaena azotica FACHB-119 TaxID=947527 RepID=A0ABR8D0M6_9NOST|nr:hypothetical protein [Anabaena azotica]MBD2500703.1 hypothetical protein [Anabaena azotica FACHB-119]
MTPPVDINFPQGLLQSWQVAKNYVTQSVNSLTNSAQQVEQSLQQTTSTATDQVIDTLTTKLGQSWQTAEQIKNTTSVAVQTSINSSINDWLAQHPTFLRLVQILNWATNHPIISLIISLFAIAFIWSIIKAIIRLIETASLSILQVPIKMLQGLIKISIFSLSQAGNFAAKRLNNHQVLDKSFIFTTDTQIIYPDKRQRLAEIAHRLEEIQKEQQELLKEASDLMANHNNIMSI